MKKLSISVFGLICLGLIISGNVAHAKSSKKMTESKAVELVKKSPGVKKWLDEFTNPNGTSPKTGGKPVFAPEVTESGEMRIHVYEDMEDHVSTFGWFLVNPKTGKIQQE